MIPFKKGRAQTMKIRWAETRDMPRINELLMQVELVHHNIRPDLFRNGGRKYTNEQLAAIIADDARPILVAVDENDYLLGYAFCIFQQHPDADGFFSTDLVALNAMKVIRKLGKRIPDDVVVVGYDGVECAKLCNPELTHVKQPLEEIARTCVDILLQKIAGEAVSENVFLKNVVLVRGGTSF